MTVPFQAATCVGTGSLLSTVAACAAAAGASAAAARPMVRMRLRGEGMASWCNDAAPAPARPRWPIATPSGAEVAPHHRGDVGDRPRAAIVGRVDATEGQRPQRVDAM